MKKRFKRLYRLLRRPLTLTSLVLLCSFTGCVRQKGISIDIVSYSNLPATIVKKIDSANKIKTVKAYADVDLIFRGNKRSSGVIILIEGPDKMRLDFIDPLAGVVSSLFYYPGYDEDLAAIKKATKLAWEPEQLIGILRGGAPDYVSLEGVFPKDSEGRYWLRPNNLAVSMTETKEKVTLYKTGKGNTVIEYGDYQKHGRLNFPGSITIESDKPKVFLKLKFRDVVIDGKIPPEVFIKQ